jgi:hypothetical protein
MRIGEPGEGPEPEELRRKLERHLSGLRGTPPFVVAQLLTPSFVDAQLQDVGTADGEYSALTLRYEDDPDAGRAVSVTSTHVGTHSRFAVGSHLREAILHGSWLPRFFSPW